ncbi:serine hydrolase [Aquabacterium sp. OR-4]|uniref:serine hydrolase n=1 Tax=Aquabacterium sp. OR-4 TaxID=2978127 RepID=UPI0021B179F1|nr:serine hydrolase [Aquabacterium sp. OR-4]MDT7838840.1 serine hydrolase [Aquabacterium sp. OR-4]
MAVLLLTAGGPALHAAPADELADLAQALGDADPYRRGAAAVALGRIGAAAVPALTRSLGSDQAERRGAAAIALGRMGAPAQAALPELVGLLSDSSALVRQVAARTLGGLAGLDGVAQAALQPLTRCLSDHDEAVRRSATWALERLAPGQRAQQLQHHRLVATLDALLPALLVQHQVPGAAVALIRDRRLVWSGGYGRRSAAAGEAVTPDTVFEAASMSKPVMAMLAMQLVDRGQLDLDRPVVAYGPELLVPDQPEKQRVTARMLLAHTSGYPNWRSGGEEIEGPLPLLFQPGAKFGYSGEGSFYLQRRIEWISGLPLERLAHQRLFGPLGLQHSDFGWTPQIGARQATGHGDDGRPRPPSRYLHPNAAYTLYTTVDDYARLLVEVMKAAQGEPALLSQAAAQEMLRPQVVVEAREPIERPGAAQGQAVYWGLGWALNRTAQGDIAHHSGANSTGFRSFSQFSPSRGSGLVILTNGAQGDELWKRLVAAIGDL